MDTIFLFLTSIGHDPVQSFTPNHVVVSGGLEIRHLPSNTTSALHYRLFVHGNYSRGFATPEEVVTYFRSLIE